MKTNWQRIVATTLVLGLVLALAIVGVVIWGLDTLHNDLASVRQDIATLNDGLAQTTTELTAIKTSVGYKTPDPSLSTGLVGEIHAIRSDVGQMQTRVNLMQTDVNSIQTDVSNLQGDVFGIALDVNWIRLNTP